MPFLFLRLLRPPEFREDDPWYTEMVRLPLALHVPSFLSWHKLWEMQSSPGASQVVLVVNNPPATAGDIRDTGSIPGSGRSPGGGHGNPLQYSCLENPHGQRGLAGYSPRGHKQLNMTEWLSTEQHNTQLIYNVIPIFSAQQRDSVIHIFFKNYSSPL